MRILVTGATGFIGRSLVDALREIAVLRTTSRGGAGWPDHRPADLTRADEAAAVLRWASPTVVIHLAGGRSGTVAATYSGNVSTTASVLLAAAFEGQRPYVIVPGSAEEYGAGDQIGERAPLSPSTSFGRAKTAQVAMARRLAGREGIPLTVVRPFTVVGPGLPTATPLGRVRSQLLNAGSATPEVGCGPMDVKRDFVPASFVTAVLARLAMDPQPDRTLNICSGVGLSMRSVADAMAARLGLRPTYRVDPRLAASAHIPVSVGDPSLLADMLSMRFRATAESIADAVLGREAPTLPPPPRAVVDR
jgi:nucleoside-diphosphate-sugar epimerase